jgi:hypothetical protein
VAALQVSPAALGSGSATVEQLTRLLGLRGVLVDRVAGAECDRARVMRIVPAAIFFLQLGLDAAREGDVRRIGRRRREEIAKWNRRQIN